MEFEYLAKCRVLKKIAEGGMGSVYLAEQLGAEGFSKTVVIKAINKEHLNSPTAVKLFVGEAKLVADLVHSNIVQVYQFGQIKGVYFIMMEYVHGVNLWECLARHSALNRKLPIELGAFIISRVCRGLHYAHQKADREGRPLRIVHRDVSPTNILLDFRGAVKLSDFGAAKAVTLATPDEKRTLVGKYGFMSPEQIKLKGTDHRSDIFSLGLVLYEVLTGQRVYDVRTREEMIDKIDHQKIPAAKSLDPEIPDDLNAIAMRAIEKESINRYQSVVEMGNALEYYMYHDRYGPTNEKLAAYLAEVFPEEAKREVL